jgi:hypothetical protein
MSVKSDKTVKQFDLNQDMDRYKVLDSNKFNFLSGFKQKF